MLLHILKLFHRTALKSKTTFLINVLGLSTGLAAALLIFLWINDEFSMDRFHRDGDRIFQVLENQKTSAGIVTQGATPIGMAYVLAQSVPEVEYAATVTPNAWFPKFLVESEAARVKKEGRFVGRDFFRIFSYELAYGDRETIFNDIHSIALSESLAETLFGSVENAAGRMLSWTVGEIRRECVVTGVFRDNPHNSSEQFDMLLNIELLGVIMNFAKDDLTAPGPSTFVKLRKGAEVNDFNTKVSRLMAERTDKPKAQFFASKFQDKYLYGKFKNGVQQGTRILYVRLFGIVGGIILLVACINFMNLSTAKATVRMKEVGVRKTMGALRKSLITQFLGESLFIALVSLVVSVVLVALLLPYFNEVTGKELVMDLSLRTVIVFVSIAVATGLIAGSYPAFYLSGFKPALVLKGQFSTSINEVFVRKGLVVFQFTVSIIFIIAVMVVNRQMSFIQHKDLGYDHEHVLYFEIEGKVAQDHHAFIETVRSIPGVTEASAMLGNIVGAFGNPQDLMFEGKPVAVNRLNVDHGMIELLDIRMNAGRTFSPSFNDSDKIILNHAAIDRMDVTDPIGKTVDFAGRQFEIIGVTENFHYRSLHEEITPLAFLLETESLWNIFVKIEPGTAQSTITKLQKLYAQFNPGYVFDYRFLDHTYQSQYKAEQRVASLSLWFAILSIVIACSGLFGLAAFSADRRVKEIGIRKVLGATSWSIVILLTLDFLRLVLIAIAIALPLGFYLTSEWLSSFAYTIDLSAWLFACGGAIALTISLLTVAGQAVKASGRSVVESLRS